MDKKLPTNISAAFIKTNAAANYLALQLTFQHIYLSVYLSIYMSMISIHLSIYLSISECIWVSLVVYLFCLFTRQSTSMFLCRLIYPFICSPLSERLLSNLVDFPYNSQVHSARKKGFDNIRKLTMKLAESVDQTLENETNFTSVTPS